MLGRTGFTLARFFQRISRVLQSFAHRAFGSLCAVLDRLAGGFCAMLDRLAGGLRAMLNSLARFFRGFLHGLAGFLDGPLILRSRCERYAKRQSDYQCEMFHSHLQYSSHKDALAAVCSALLQLLRRIRVITLPGPRLG